MLLIIILLVVILGIILFRKKILSMAKMVLNNKKLLIGLIFAIVVGIIIFTAINYKRNNHLHGEKVNKETCEMVREYISQTYNMEGKIIQSSLVYNTEGFTGGMFQYTFKFKDSSGKIFFIEYREYGPLSEGTLERLKLKSKE